MPRAQQTLSRSEYLADVAHRPFALPNNGAGRYALGRLKTGEMNKTEYAYSEHLRLLQLTDKIAWYKFEAVKLRLADSTFYSPDFLVLHSDGVLEVHEVKGVWEDDARVKIKVAASLYPFRFIAVTARAKKLGGGWDVETF
jgi:hypothetical protein